MTFSEDTDLRHFQGIDEVRLGFIALFVPRGYNRSDGRLRTMTDILMAVAGRFERQIIETDSPVLQWGVGVRRPSIVRAGSPSYAIVPFRHGTDPRDAGRFLRHNLFDILADDERTVILYEPPVAEPECDCAAPCEACLAAPGLDISENSETSAIERERQQWIDALQRFAISYIQRFHEMPPMADIERHIRGKLMIESPSALSRITVNGDFRIFLPEFNELELKMTPLVRTLYIFFLAHPEGIRLKEISDHSKELAQIYSLVKPGADDRLAAQSISDLISPCSDSLQQKLSMSRKAIRRQILNRPTAERYMITGHPGGLYRIALPTELITLPRILINS